MANRIITRTQATNTLRQTVKSSLEEKRQIISCVMVAVDYTNDPAVAGRGGWVWVREHGKTTSEFGGVFQALNPHRARRVNLPVLVGRAPRKPYQWMVLDVDWGALESDTAVTEQALSVKAHGQTHAFVPGRPDVLHGTDVADIYERNIASGRVYPTSPASMTCAVAPVVYLYGSVVKTFVGGYTVNFTTAVPVTAGMAKLAFVGIDGATGALTYAYSGEFVWTNYGDMVPSSVMSATLPVGCVLLSAVLLYNGMTAIVERNFTYEMRPIFAAVGMGMTSGASSGNTLPCCGA